MHKIVKDILNNLSGGIVLLNEQLEVYFWNNYMEHVTSLERKKVLEKNIYDVFPNFHRDYYKKAIEDVMKNGCKMFFSATLHHNLIHDKEKFNFKMSRVTDGEQKYLLLEFINVTSEFVRTSQLKENIDTLMALNKKLKEKEKLIKNLAYYDQLTGIANRTLFYKIAKKYLAQAQRNETMLGIMFIDVDQFKCINDTYGHEVGDRVLIKVANILKESTRKNDVVARYGGDEFVILFSDAKHDANYKAITSRIANHKNKALYHEGKNIHISLSMGVSYYPKDGNYIDELIAKADKGMYMAKSKKGADSCFCI